MISQAEIRNQLPEHLRQFVAEQNYETRYSAEDQAVWRLVLKLLVHQLQDSAHSVYFEGLSKTGIRLDKIPSIDDMNRCLSRLGWRAIVVDGFIPPQAFMELQSLKVLAIALDMRRVEHILYTPAPDIIHEAAGHAPIIADVEYSEYLQRFGEVGMRALYNQYDVDLYEAVRELSIAKEAYSDTSTQVTQAEHALNHLLQHPGEPSELALLTRLHWWTVEYGLVGEVENYKLFGAGLLSSLLESKSCLNDDEVKKLPLTIEAINQPYDITREQPKLFVTKSCRHLTQILDEFASTMCFQRGGTQSLIAAANTGVVTTSQLSSGICVSGRFNPPITNAIGEAIYLSTSGHTQLSYNQVELDGHGIQFHQEGFGSPLGRLCNLMKPLESATEYELQQLNIFRDEPVTLEFISGVKVSGHLQSITKKDNHIVMMTFTACTVKSPSGHTLFHLDWGTYDMVVSERIESVFAGSGDAAMFNVYPKASKKQTSECMSESNQLFEKLVGLTDQVAVTELLDQHPENALLQMEALVKFDHNSDGYRRIIERLNGLTEHHPWVTSFLAAERNNLLV